MNLEKLRSWAKIPRDIPGDPALKRLVPCINPLEDAILITVALSVLVELGALFGRWRHWFGWTPALVPLAVIALAALANILSRPIGFSRGRAQFRDAPLVLAAVVQANQDLFTPGESMLPAVLLFSTDPRRALDAPWLQSLARKLAGLREAPPSEPALAALAARLEAERESFDELLPASLTDGAPVRWKVNPVDPSMLPGRRIPEDGLIPYFYFPEGSWLMRIPAALWD